MIYLDNNATTPLHPAVLAEMEPFLTSSFGNPSAGYKLGKEARKAVDQARQRVAELLGARPEEVIFTSCGTESINTAIHSGLELFPSQKRILTTTVEHSATEKTCQYWESQGYTVTRLEVDSQGGLDVDAYAKALGEGGIALVSIIWANNETGVIFQVPDLARMAAEAGILFHTDAVQAVGKIPIHLQETPIHMLSLSGHKLHAPKGIGALVVNREIRFRPFIFGGGQENERRSGTENVTGIVGLGKAAELARQDFEERTRNVRFLRDRFEAALLEALPGTEINGHPEHRLANTSNLHFPGVDGEALLVMLDERGIACSPGSACSSGAGHPSLVLQAMGFAKERAKRSIRVSLSRFTTEAEIDQAVAAFTECVKRFQSVRPSSAGPVRQG